MLADVTLSLGDYGVFAVMMATSMAVPAALLGFIVKANRQEQADMRGEVKTLHKRADRLTGDKVSREDWLRDSTRTEHKLDRVLENQAKLSATVDAHIGLAAPMERIASAMERTVRKDTHGREEAADGGN